MLLILWAIIGAVCLVLAAAGGIADTVERRMRHRQKKSPSAVESGQADKENI